jgi:Glycosyltransferase 61
VIDEDVVWGGPIVNHYGHFLTESVARLWPVLPGGELSGTPVVFTTPTSRGYAREWLQAFGARTIELPQRGLTLFKRLIVPEPAWRLNAWVAPEIRDIHLHAREGMELPEIPAREILWLSRSALYRPQRTYDERFLEWILDRQISSIHPETMSLAEQVAAVEASDAVAGIIGSAFHTVLMARRPPKCVYLCPGRVMSTYLAQDELLGDVGAFAQSLATTQMKTLTKFRLAGTYRVSIPETLRSLRRCLPSLVEDSRIDALALPETWRASLTGSSEEQLERAAVGVVLDPLSIRARINLATQFEACGDQLRALEQYTIVADLSEENVYAPARAAQLLARLGETAEASEMAKRALAIDPSSPREAEYAAKAAELVIDP